MQKRSCTHATWSEVDFEKMDMESYRGSEPVGSRGARYLSTETGAGFHDWSRGALVEAEYLCPGATPVSEAVIQ